MDMIKRDCRNRIYRSLGTFCILLFIIAVLLLTVYAGSLQSLFHQETPFENYEKQIINKENNDYFNDLKNEYTSIDVKKIIGSYAEYGNTESNKREWVYYLMPIQNGTYFISIIANKENIIKFDELEQIFLKNLGEDKKTYAEGFPVSGGFVTLSEEEKAYAFEFFKGYDENVKDVNQLSQILSPYAISIGEIGNTKISTLWTILFIASSMFGIAIIIMFVIYKDILLKDLLKNIEVLSEDEKTSLEEDYKHAEVIHDVKFGKMFLYLKTRFAYKIISYNDQIWMYKEQSSKERIIAYQIQAYNKEGKATMLYKNSDETIVDNVLNTLFDHCKIAILGYQFSLHVTAMENPEKLYKKIRETLYLEDEKAEEVNKKIAETIPQNDK